MLFTSVSFLFYFLPAVLGLYYVIRRRGWRNGVLTLTSLFFYGWGGWRYLVVMLASIAWNWVFALAVCGCQKNKRRAKLMLILGITGNLVVLGYFKYLNFFADTLSPILGIGGELARIALPVGISFYTFQGISYLVDVYRSQARALKNPADVALYTAMFPQLVAGPIVRFSTIDRQLQDREETFDDFVAGLSRFILGLGKKLLLANAMGEAAASIFVMPPGALSVSTAWLGALAYTLQIYLDFSSYSDMAIGLGRMFGFQFLENFNYPYIARSVRDFWHRWHISLSTWFRDYVYIPLGGSRVSSRRLIFNMLLVWLLTGFWHGANWNFIFWGLYYGLLLLGERFIWGKAWQKLPGAIQWAVTFVLVMIGWVFFNAPSLTYALGYIGAMFGIGANGLFGAQVRHVLDLFSMQWILALIACLPLSLVLNKWLGKLEAGSDGASSLAAAMRYGYALFVLALSVLMLLNTSFNPFIYFQF